MSLSIRNISSSTAWGLSLVAVFGNILVIKSLHLMPVNDISPGSCSCKTFKSKGFELQDF